MNDLSIRTYRTKDGKLRAAIEQEDERGTMAHLTPAVMVLGHRG